jgi:hypothetical protein
LRNTRLSLLETTTPGLVTVASQAAETSMRVTRDSSCAQTLS